MQGSCGQPASPEFHRLGVYRSTVCQGGGLCGLSVPFNPQRLPASVSSAMLDTTSMYFPEVGMASVFTPGASTCGGLLLGVASLALLYANGRIAGITGIVAGLARPRAGERAWRAAFVVGLCAGGLLLRCLRPAWLCVAPRGDLPMLVIAGLLVGAGTRMANGCTSGHGVCGLSRRSPRSLVATATFMATAIAMVFVTRHVFGGPR